MNVCKKDVAALVVAAAVGFFAAPIVVGYIVDHSTTNTVVEEPNPAFGVDGQGPMTAEETETARTMALRGEALRLDMIRTLCQTKEVECK